MIDLTLKAGMKHLFLEQLKSAPLVFFLAEVDGEPLQIMVESNINDLSKWWTVSQKPGFKSIPRLVKKPLVQLPALV